MAGRDILGDRATMIIIDDPHADRIVPAVTGTCGTCRFWEGYVTSTNADGVCHNTEAGLGAHIARHRGSPLCAYFRETFP